MDSTLEAAESVKFHDVKRLGEIEKCPVCGSKADAGAYHCSQCRNNFCYRCRARVLPAEPQFQCINQKCDYYGKLVCGICDPAISQPEPPTIYLERIGGWWPPLLAGSVVIFLLGLFWLSFWYAFLLGVIAFAGMGYGLDRLGLKVLGQTKTITETRESVHHDFSRVRAVLLGGMYFYPSVPANVIAWSVFHERHGGLCSFVLLCVLWTATRFDRRCRLPELW